MFPRTGVRLTDTIRIRGAWARLCHMMVFGRVRLPSEEEFEDPGMGGARTSSEMQCGVEGLLGFEKEEPAQGGGGETAPDIRSLRAEVNG